MEHYGFFCILGDKYWLSEKMKNKAQLLPFLFVVMVYLVAMFFGFDTVKLFFKPLIVGSLLLYFVIETKNKFVRFRLWMILAMVYCMAGDTFLMFDSRDELFFILGLVSFLVGHVFYILVFKRIANDKFISFHILKTILVIAYVTVLLYLLIPRANTLWLPVVLYSLVIGTMLVFAFHLTKIGRIGWLITAGAFLFVISDSVIALNKFYVSIPLDSWIVMISYIVAQFLIVHGVVKYILQR